MNKPTNSSPDNFEYQSVDTVLSAVMVGGLAVTAAVMLMVGSVQALVA
jgi:hypothetical protein